jgi:Tol biopolymer transport system component
MRNAVKAATTLVALPLLLAPAADAAFPGSNGKIAYVHRGATSNDIWVVDPGSGSKQNLTQTSRANESFPDWNATGTQMVYSKCGRGQLSNCEIWMMNADGSEKTRLTFTTESPDPLVPHTQETWPTWSPDGTKIAYTSNQNDIFQDIWVMDADGENQTRLTVNEAFDAFPEWSPDGSKIAFTSDRAEVDDIWVVDADGDNPLRLTSGQGVDERPDWSPDGARLVFSRNGRNIWAMNAGGTELTKVTDTRRPESAPAFSPNGNRIAFHLTAKDGRIGVWAMRADGTKRKQLTFGKFDLFPDWQPLGGSKRRPATGTRAA